MKDASFEGCQKSFIDKLLLLPLLLLPREMRDMKTILSMPDASLTDESKSQEHLRYFRSRQNAKKWGGEHTKKLQRASFFGQDSIKVHSAGVILHRRGG